MNYTERTKLVDGLCGVALMALLVEFFYGLTDASFTVFHYNLSTVSSVIYVLGGVALLAAVLLLIFAYKKDSGSLACYGMEFLVLAISAPILPATYMTLPMPLNKLNAIFPVAFLVYYVIKAMMLLSKRNVSNSVMVGIIGTIYTLVMGYGLYAYTETFFVIASVATVIMFIVAMVKRSKFILAHALEAMIATFFMLVATSKTAIVFFLIFGAVFYVFKAAFTMSAPTKSKKAKSKK